MIKSLPQTIHKTTRTRTDKSQTTDIFRDRSVIYLRRFVIVCDLFVIKVFFTK